MREARLARRRRKEKTQPHALAHPVLVLDFLPKNIKQMGRDENREKNTALPPREARGGYCSFCRPFSVKLCTMKISLDWLSDFITWKEHDPYKIAERLTICTAEVEEVEIQGDLLSHCCIGKVLSVTKHPNADKLSLCAVQTDQGTKHVVCGGTNLSEGMCVAFAHTGARVRWHGTELLTLQKTKIRGEESEGMICAAEELDLVSLFPHSKERTIIDLGENDKDVGKPLREYFGLTDTILHVDNHAITHRPDLFSQSGFARECVALGLGIWKRNILPKKSLFPKTPLPFKLNIDVPHLMPRYCACCLTIDSLGETPFWMRRRLEALGWRSLNLPIDITNYVALECGVPLHSFDAEDFVGDIHMRTTEEGEKIVTLDKIQRRLPEGALVLSDEEGIFDLLGIMGGLRSSTKESSRHIYLHSASLEPLSIRKTMIATGLRTDAGTVYEKGVPHITTEVGFFRALQLFTELVPGVKIVSQLDSRGDNGKAPAITLHLEKINSYLGTDMSKTEAEKTLSTLGFTTSHPTSAAQQVQTCKVFPPLWRLGDIHGEHDLIEEVGRIHGYDMIPPVVPTGILVPPSRDQRSHSLRDTLKAEGYFEILPVSLIRRTLLEQCCIDHRNALRIENPLGEESALLIPSTLPLLLEHAQKNLTQREHIFKTFTIAHTFAEGREEYAELGMLLVQKDKENLSTSTFLQIKEHLQEALNQTGLALALEPLPSPPSFGHPCRSAHIVINGKPLGFLLDLHPSVRSVFDLPPCATVLLNLSLLQELHPRPLIVQPLPRFPTITYDFTTPRTHKQPVALLLQSLRSCSPLLLDVTIRDVFAPHSTDPEFNLTIRCTYGASDRTLTEKEAQREHAKVMALAQN